MGGTILCQHQQISEGHKVTKGRGTILCQRQQISEDHKVTTGRGTILCQRQQISEDHKVTKGRGTIFMPTPTRSSKSQRAAERFLCQRQPDLQSHKGPRNDFYANANQIFKVTKGRGTIFMPTPTRSSKSQ